MITIIIIIILASIVFLSLKDTNTIDSSRVAQISQTREAIDSAVLLYVSDVEEKMGGKYNSADILLELEEETYGYGIVDYVSCTIKENGKIKTLYRIDKDLAKTKLNIDLPYIDSGSAWYIDKTGKVYLIYESSKDVSTYLKQNNDEILPSVSGFVSVAENIVESSEKTVTITLNANGGTIKNSKVKVLKGKNASLPVPELVGYDFEGWYTDDTFETKLEGEWTPNENQTLIANWTPSTNTVYKVIHKLMGFDASTYNIEEVEERTGTTGQEVQVSTNEYPGFTAPTAQTVTILPDGSAEVEYLYTRNAYQYVLSTGNGTITDGSTPSGIYFYGATIILRCSIVEGYSSASWNSSDESLITNPTELNTTIIMPAGNLTMASKAVAPTCTITLNANGGNVESSTVEAPKGQALELPTPTLTGYTLEGWYLDEELKNKITSEYIVTNEINVYAKYTPNTNTAYKVIHSLMGLDGTSYSQKETQNLTGTTGSSVTPAVKTYAGFTAPTTQTVTILADGSTEVIYKYTRNKYTYTLSTGTGTTTSGSSASGSYYYGSTITLKCAASSGYESAKWTSSNTSLVSSPTTLNTTFTMPNGNITMTSSATGKNLQLHIMQMVERFLHHQKQLHMLALMAVCLRQHIMDTNFWDGLLQKQVELKLQHLQQ